MVATQAMSILAKSLALFCNFLKDQIIRECSWTDLNQRRQVCVLPIARHGYIGEGVIAYLFWTLMVARHQPLEPDTHTAAFSVVGLASNTTHQDTQHNTTRHTT